MAGKNRIFLAAAVGVVFVAAVAVIVLGRRSPDGKQALRAHDAAQGAAELDAARQADTPADARHRADELRARIHALIATARLEAGAELVADAQHAPRAAPSASPTRSELLVDRYLRALAREEFLPMARACYGDLVKQSPDARGRVMLHVVVVGHPAAGGVVDSVQLDSGSTLDDPQLMSCLVESMLALSFGAPPEGQARLEFDYPFEFPDSDAHDRPR